LIYIYLFVKELFFIYKNKNNNIKIIGSKYIIIGIISTMIMGTIIEIIFNLYSIYVPIAIINSVFIGVIMHNDIIVSDNELLYRNIKIDLTNIKGIKVINERKDYTIIDIEFENRIKRISIKTQFLELLN
jgi:hypothetical protein